MEWLALILAWVGGFFGGVHVMRWYYGRVPVKQQSDWLRPLGASVMEQWREIARRRSPKWPDEPSLEEALRRMKRSHDAAVAFANDERIE